MKLEKNIYIETELNKDYILIAKNSGIGQMALAFIFLTMQKTDATYFFHILFVLAILVITIAFRLFFYTKYSKNFALLLTAVKVTDYTSIACSVFWATIGIYSVSNYQYITANILVTFMILTAISLGSMNTLSHRKKIFLVFNIIILMPLLYFAVIEESRSESSSTLWLFAYCLLSILYTTKQAQYINKEAVKRFSIEFDLKKSVEEIELSKKKLEEETIKTFHATRLSSLGEMAGGVAHEINNPLTIVQVLTKSLLNYNFELVDDRIKSKLEKIYLARERIAKIVKGMKAISSKNDKMEHSQHKVSELIELSLSLLEERIKNETIDFTIVNHSDPIIYCNSLQISQIIINLIGNAIDAMENIKEEKKLSIEVSEQPKHRSDESFVEVNIINSGPPIPEEIVNKIFEPFYSTKTFGKGTGLGLSISRNLARANNGDLIYKPSNGFICFKLTLNSNLVI